MARAGYTVLDVDTGRAANLLDGGTSGGKLLRSYHGVPLRLVAGIYIAALIGALVTGGATLGAFLAWPSSSRSSSSRSTC